MPFKIFIHKLWHTQSKSGGAAHGSQCYSPGYTRVYGVYPDKSSVYPNKKYIIPGDACKYIKKANFQKRVYLDKK